MIIFYISWKYLSTFSFFFFTLLTELSLQPYPIYECAEIQVFTKTHMSTCIAAQITDTDNRRNKAIQIQQTAFNHKFITSLIK